MRIPFTDHHIQDKIIFKLVNGKTRFSELVPDEMEHSLFMYHMKKLISAGVVEKDGQQYRLTMEGAKKYNARYRLAKPLRQPTLLIQFLVLDEDQVLLSRRTILQENLNEYMLPGGAHSFLSSSRKCAGQIAKTRGLHLGDFFATVETIAPARTFHGLIDVYLAEQVTEDISDQSHELVWMPVKDVLAMDFNKAGSAPFIVRQYKQGSSSSHLTNVISI